MPGSDARGRVAGAGPARTRCAGDPLPRQRTYHCEHDKYLRLCFGITCDNYLELLDLQAGHCALCPRRPGRRRLAVDEDHDTREVRGLLCSSCNRRLSQRVTRYVLDPPGRRLGLRADPTTRDRVEARHRRYVASRVRRRGTRRRDTRRRALTRASFTDRTAAAVRSSTHLR